MDQDFFIERTGKSFSEPKGGSGRTENERKHEQEEGNRSEGTQTSGEPSVEHSTGEINEEGPIFNQRRDRPDVGLVPGVRLGMKERSYPPSRGLSQGSTPRIDGRRGLVYSDRVANPKDCKNKPLVYRSPGILLYLAGRYYSVEVANWTPVYKVSEGREPKIGKIIDRQGNVLHIKGVNIETEEKGRKTRRKTQRLDNERTEKTVHKRRRRSPSYVTLGSSIERELLVVENSRNNVTTNFW